METKVLKAHPPTSAVVCGLGALAMSTVLSGTATAEPVGPVPVSNRAEYVLLLSVDGMLLWLNDRSGLATEYARDFLLNYSDSTASVDGKPVTSAGLTQVYTGAAAARLIGVPLSDSRVPDVIGIAQYGVVYTSHHGKIAEHGGDHLEDRNVPILIARPGTPGGTAVTKPVETTQIAPTILKLLGLNPHELQAVRLEGTEPLF